MRGRARGRAVRSASAKRFINGQCRQYHKVNVRNNEKIARTM